ncbi:hypothetical protein AKJ52_02250 [candidate division MSBL1 archaeon SCGC-AAA382C18]|uniref:Uncharacterized protein n=1 Tax=candidate division MSBL1 archaeon SCGC-AAA382C18 TaxID=1698281 RepID=A0A133VIY7_9EURY|nr:hypothetical protein AKJ52_02250 [candidate division MSBL1 archaeon SCGC-AAA382C18]
MKKEDREAVDRVFELVRPYISDSDDLRKNLNQNIELSSNLDEFVKNFEETTSQIDDSSKKTDCKIFLNKLKSW